MDKVQELRKQLIAAEDEQKAKILQDELDTMNNAFAGRICVYTSADAYSGSTSVVMLRYGSKFTRDAFGHIKYKVESVRITTTRTLKNKVRRNQSYITYNQDDIGLGGLPNVNDVHYVEPQVFADAKALAMGIAATAYDKFCPTDRVKHADDWVRKEDLDAEEVAVDFPFVKVEPYDTVILGEDNPYMMIGYRYLLTPQSRVMALQKIADEEKSLYRTSGMWESCDMKYVESKEASIVRLRALIKGA